MRYGLIDELLGFLALSAGPLALVVVLVLGIIAIRWVVRRTGTRGKQWAAGLITALIIVLIFTWDVIAGRIHFNHLCATESGIRVYKHVGLDPEYRDIKFSGNPLSYERTPIAKRYPYSFDSSDNIPGPGTIAYSRESIRDAQTSEVLGTITTYFWGGGWFENAISNQAGGGNCGHEKGGFDVLLEQIFKVSR